MKKTRQSLSKLSETAKFIQSSNQLLKEKRFSQLLDLFEQKGLGNSNDLPILHMYGLAYSGLNDHEAAVRYFLRAIKVNPLDPFPYFNIGNSLAKNVQFEEAKKYYKLALTIDENCVDALVGLGVTQFQESDYENCEINFKKGMAAQPKNAQIITNLGNTYLVQGRFDEALDLLNHALKINPNQPMARTNRGLIKLGQADFETGWGDYEYRFHDEAFSVKRFQSIPQWRGPSSRTTDKVFIWSEQGLGDEIMFASIFRDLEECSETFYVECDSRLIEIFKVSFPKLRFLNKTVKGFDGIDYQLPLASLGLIFRKSTSSFRQYPSGYLRLPDQGLPEPLSNAINALQRPLIGVSWESYALTRNFRDRKSISAKQFEIITSSTNCSFINLQYPNPHKHEKSILQEVPAGITTLPDLDLKNDMVNLAHLLKKLDGVISIGNSVAHLCGGFGIETKVLLPSVSDWRWGYSGERSPWYESLVLYRNKESDSWEELLKSISMKV